MKYGIFLALTLSAVAFAVPTKASASACGGVVQQVSDCGDNNREWHYSCCPDGSLVQGVAYTDIQDQDHVDAVSAVCHNSANGNVTMPQDFSRTPKTFVCSDKEILAGIVSKDVHTDAGGKRDTLDGVSAICLSPGSKSLSTVMNVDITENERQGREQKVSAPQRIVGIAYKERDNGGKKTGSSDRADCVTIITK